MKRKFFIKRLIIYLLTMLIPISLLFIAFGVVNINSIDKKLKEQGKKTVNAVAVNFDLVLSNVLYQNDLLTGMTRMNLSLKRMLEQEKLSYGDAVGISSLRAILSSICDSHEYIDSIYIYLDGTKRFFSSEKGIYDINEQEDVGWMPYYENMEDYENSYIASRNISKNSVQQRVLSVYKRLVMQQGCIVVNINVEKLRDILEKQISVESETIILINETGDILLQQSEGKNAENTDFSEVRLFDLNEIDGKWINTENGKFLITIKEYPQMNVSFVSAISQKTRITSIISALPLFFAFLFIDVFVAVILAYITTKRSFDQISYMIQVFDEAEKGLPVKKPQHSNRDEYDIIMNNIVYLFLNANFLNTQLMENESKRAKAEMMALQLQINPHFLFNTLQTVDMEVRDGSVAKEEISRIIRYLSDILKYVLESPSEFVRLEEEISYLKKYVAIQKYRFGDSFILYYDIDEDLRDARVFRLFLQPLVENSLLHGIRKAGRKGYIKVSIKKRDNRILCSVIDTGKGMNREEVKELTEGIENGNSGSIGLTNLSHRLLLHYGEESSLVIRAKAGMGTSISFSIPLE